MTTTEQLSALSSILTQSGLHSLFQPIISLSERQIIGYEALSRGPSNNPLHSPIALFAVARQAGRLNELEIACRESACRRFNEQQLPGKLFLNVSPESLLEAAHQPGRTLQLLQDFGIPPSQVVIELTEQTPTDDFQLAQAPGLSGDGEQRERGVQWAVGRTATEGFVAENSAFREADDRLEQAVQSAVSQD